MMKKLLAVMITVAMTAAMAGCGAKEAPAAETAAEAQSAAEESTAAAESVAAEAESAAAESTAAETESAAAETANTEEAAAAKSEGVMTYEEYMAAELDTEVVVETYVQAKQSWWEDKATVYTQDEDGAYFIYNMACSEEDYAKLEPGTKIKVTGYKAEWSGEVEIIDATFEIEEGSYLAEAADMTELLGTEELIAHQNEFVSFTGMTVEDAGEGKAFLYNWDGSGTDGDDLYFNVSLNGETYTFTVESYLCDSTTEVYNTVKNLKVGDVVDMEGFLYWYEGVNPHITAVTVK